MARAEDTKTPDLRDYGRLFWRHRWLILAVVAIAVGSALGFVALRTPVYEGTAQVILQPSGSQQILDSSPQNAQDAARNVDTETAVMRSRATQDAATKFLGHEPNVSISSDASSDVVSVSARSTGARRAASDANGYAQAYVAQRRHRNIDDLAQAGEQLQAKISEIDRSLQDLTPGSPDATTAQEQRAFLQRQLDQLQLSSNLNQVGGARILARAEVPDTPVEPQPARDVAIALVLGLLLGVGLAFLREHFDDTVTTRDDLERATDGLPVLAEISQVTAWRDEGAPHVVSREAPSSAAAEGYRTLRTAIQFLGVERSLKSIQVTSSRSDDGKSTTLANLAVAFARLGVKVTIVCCDLRQPRVHEFFGVPNEVGFTTVLLGQASVSEALQAVPGEPNIALLSAGPPPPNPSELLASARARDVISALEEASDLVLVDSPPILPVTDGILISGITDGTLLVASAKSSSRRAMHRTVQGLRQVDAVLIGTVLNRADPAEGFGMGGYGYAQRDDPSANGAGGSRWRRRRPTQPMALNQRREVFGS